MATTNYNVNTTTNFDHPVNIVFQKEFLKTLKKELLYTLLAKKVGMPKNAGTTVKWRRIADGTAQTTPLSELGEPTPILMSKTDISTTVQPYGAVTILSKLLKMTGYGSEQQEFVDKLTYIRDLTLDTLNRNVLAGASSTTTCSHSTDGTTTHLNSTDVDAVVQTMLNSDCRPTYPIITATTGVGTTPIEQGFPVILHTKAWTTLRAIGGFIPISQYPKQVSMLPGEIGSYGYARFCLTTNGYYDGTTYYYATFLSEGAYGNVEITGSQEPLISKEVGVINPVQHLGWYLTHAAKILEEIRLHTLKFTV